MRAFCFCGFHELRALNSIESVELELEGEWRSLPLDKRVSKAFQLAAVSLRNSILVFGGLASTQHKMEVFSEEGGLLKGERKLELMPK